MTNKDLLTELVAGAEAIGALALDEDHFRAGYDAFRAADQDSYQRLLAEFKISDRCELVCGWYASKECVLLCMELCGPPIDVELPDPREFAEVVTKITGDEELVERLATAVLDRDREGFRVLVEELKLQRFCHLLCHWVCTIRCRLICRMICAPGPLRPRDLVEELTVAGRSIAALVADRDVFAQVAKAASAGDCEQMRKVIGSLGIADRCEIVCEWFCSWRCLRVCLLLCRRFPVTEIPSLSEAYEFAKVTVRLAAQPDALRALVDAVESEDADAFAKQVEALQLGRFCVQLCHWICSRHCRLLCRCVCAPALRPWFTHVGHFDVDADIDAGTGLTNKPLAFSGLYFNGGPGFGFYQCLELRGFCPQASPIDGTAMRYRFVFAGPAPATPVTGAGRVCPVDAGTRIISWPEKLADGTTGPNPVATFQTISIQADPVPDPVPPAPGDPWQGPARHVINPDANGWITVEPTISGGYTTLIGFNTTLDVPGGDPNPGVPAGDDVPAGSRRAGSDLSITFEATRVGGPSSPPDSTNTLSKIHINNFAEVNLLDIAQFHTGPLLACTPITTALDVQYTADHELMAHWECKITSASPSAPGVVASGTTPRGGFGTVHEDTSAWNICSYLASQSTRAGLTTGLVDNQGSYQQKTFCVGRKANNG